MKSSDRVERLKKLSPAKRALLLKALQGEAKQGEDQKPIPRLVDRSRLHLSFAQQRLWFLDQFDEGSPLYNQPWAARLDGELDAKALERAINEVVRRHEALRTSIQSEDGVGVQVVEAWEQRPLSVIDMSEVSEEKREAECKRVMKGEAEEPFKLSEGRLLRVKLIKQGAGRHILLYTMHHIICDDWSVNIFIREIVGLYESYRQGEEVKLEEMVVQYGDYAEWQREWLEGEELERQMRYWREQLGGELPRLELPVSKRGGGSAAGRAGAKTGGRESVEIGEEVRRRLKEVCREEGVTMFMLLMASFKVMLSRYSGQQEIIVGTDIANRNRPEIEPLIGFFANQLVLRTDLSGDPSFRQLLAREREVALGAYQHQDVPFEAIVEELNPERSLQDSPLFQVKLVFQDATQEVPSIKGLTIRPIAVENGLARFDLLLCVIDSLEGLGGFIEYDKDLFNPLTIQRMARHFNRLLESLTEDPLQRICDIEILSNDERRQILSHSNHQALDISRQYCVHELFELQANKRPDAVAAIFEDRQITYAELNRRSNQLANFLRAQGVGPEVKVGICLERSLEMIVAILGVLKAGGAYVPLDADYPQQRLAYMIDDSHVAVLMTLEPLLEKLPTHWRQDVCLDTDWDQISRYGNGNPANLVSPDNLAYVIYTSGSTNRPKGVMVAHGALYNTMMGLQNRLELTESDALLLKFSFTFDASLLEIFGPLTTGGRLIIARPAEHLDPDDFIKLIFQNCATVIYLVPSMLRVLLDSHGLQNSLSLRTVICGGESLRAELVDQFHEVINAELHNQYGPTESTITATSTACDQPGKDVISIGRPIANAQVYVLDKSMQLLPIEVVGEIYIGGEGLARCYVNRPDLTAERFIPNPFSLSPGDRLYRSGDLAYFLPDGSLHFLGRSDHQVKVRGYRIELSEVEAAFKLFSQIDEVAVVALDDHNLTKSLVAFVVAGQGHLDIPQLKASLRLRLPDYMIPAKIVVLEKLPLTPSGKLDRKALAQYHLAEAARPEHKAEAVMAMTPTQQLLSTIFEQVLSLDQVWVDDNFFELGGHSLLATQVISRARELFSIELTVRALFEQPTVRGLSAVVDEQVVAATGLTRPPLVARERQGAMRLSFAQQRLWFIEQMEPETPLYNIAGAVRLDGELDGRALERAINEVVRRHEALRTSIQSEDGVGVQVVEAWEQRPLSVIDMSEVSEEKREAESERVMKSEAEEPFKLSEGKLVRLKLIKEGGGRHILLYTMHHIISDGWSMGVLIREVGELYESYRKGEEVKLEEMVVQYGDYAEWQREWLEGEELERQMRYWRQQLGGELPRLEMGTDRARPAEPSYEGGAERVEIGEEVRRRLKEVCRQEGVTMFMLLMASFKVMLSRYSGQEEIIVGSPVAGRNSKEVEGLIGMFVNTLVLRSKVRGEEGFDEMLRREREVALGAYQHQDVPFEKLVEELSPERDLSRSPLFQVMFVFDNANSESLQLDGLTITPINIPTLTARFDLTLIVVDGEEGFLTSLEYNKDIFDQRTIRQLLRHYHSLLKAISQTPHKRISELPILDDAELAQLLFKWNDTYQELFSDQCVHRLFEDQVRVNPDAVAVISGQGQVTYRELNRRANQLGRHLRKLGVKPERLVCLCAERGLEMLVGIFGILKAGGAYVPLDPYYPPERIRAILQDARPLVVVTHRHLVGEIPFGDSDIVLFEDLPCVSETDIACEASSEVWPDNLAYVIYTSGSSGNPKGVMITHRGLANYLVWAARFYRVGDLSGSVVHSSISFDLTITSLLVPLVCAKAVTLVDEPDSFSALAAIVEVANSSSLVKLTPSQLNIIRLQAGVERSVNMAGALVIGGEQLTWEDIEYWRHQESTVRLINEYGPTETVVGCCVYEAPDVGDFAGPVPIGKPIANTRLYLTDEMGELVPPGALAELRVAGRGVGRGYLNNAAETALKYVPDPWSEPAGRAYRTGDLARWRADGELEYIGRADGQVKIRGYRIELGEIEAVIKEHERVEQCAVVTVGEGTEKKLAAYIVPKVESRLESEEVKVYLKERLPAYMVPPRITLIAEMPLTANGKLDRKALPQYDTLAQTQRVYHAPRNDTQQVLASIWERVLGVERVGVDDNFFDLGGDSIVSIQVTSRANKEGIQLTTRQIFRHQTIRELAEVALTNRRIGNEQETIEGQAALTPIQRWFFHQDYPSAYHFNQSILLEADQSIDELALRNILTRIVQHHDALRLRFESEGGHWSQHYERLEDNEVMTVIDLSEVERSVRLSAMDAVAQQVQRSLDLGKGPLVRMALIRLGELGKRLLMVAHHLVVDGVSWRILLADMQVGYEQAINREEIDFGPKTASFKRWAERLTEYAQGEEIEREKDYWIAQSMQEVARLPVDFEGGQNTRSAERKVEVEFSSQETAGLMQEVAKAYRVKMDETLLTGIVLALRSWTGRSRFSIEMEGHGRQETIPEDVSRTVGWFTTIYPVVLDVTRCSIEIEALKAVKEQLRKIPNKGFGYGILKHVNRIEELNHGPVQKTNAEIGFNYLGRFDQVFEEGSVFKGAFESMGDTAPRQALRPYLLGISAMVAQGRLTLEFTYNKQAHKRETMENLANRFKDVLKKIIQHCSSPAAGEHTPSDFPLAKLSMKKLRKLPALIESE